MALAISTICCRVGRQDAHPGSWGDIQVQAGHKLPGYLVLLSLVQQRSFAPGRGRYSPSRIRSRLCSAPDGDGNTQRLPPYRGYPPLPADGDISLSFWYTPVSTFISVPCRAVFHRQCTSVWGTNTVVQRVHAGEYSDAPAPAPCPPFSARDHLNSQGLRFPARSKGQTERNVPCIVWHLRITCQFFSRKIISI